MVRIQCSDNNTAHTFITQPTLETVSMCQCPHLSYSTHPRFRESMWHQCWPMAGTTWGPSPMGARPSVRRYHCHCHTRQQRRPSKWIKNCNQEGLMLMKTRMKTKWKVYRRSNDYYEIPSNRSWDPRFFHNKRRMWWQQCRGPPLPLGARYHRVWERRCQWSNVPSIPAAVLTTLANSAHGAINYQ